MKTRSATILAMKVKAREKLNEEIQELQESESVDEAKAPKIELSIDGKAIGRLGGLSIGDDFFDAEEAYDEVAEYPGVTKKQIKAVQDVVLSGKDILIEIKPNGKYVVTFN